MNEISKLLITDKQEKIRIQWRVTVASISLLYLILALILMLIEVRYGFVAFLLLAIILMKLSFAWFCAYRKPGTKFISYMLLIQPVKLMFLILCSIFLTNQKYGMWSVLVWTITISLVWLYIASWRLRGVNKAIRDSNFI